MKDRKMVLKEGLDPPNPIVRRHSERLLCIWTPPVEQVLPVSNVRRVRIFGFLMETLSPNNWCQIERMPDE